MLVSYIKVATLVATFFVVCNIRYCMRVCKFGGTCMTNANISKIATVSTDSCAVVVVSAVGVSHANDSKVTDMLVKLHYMLPDITMWQAIASRYRQIVSKHCIDIDIHALLDRCIADIVANNSYHFTLSVGEYLSANIMASYLGRTYIESADVVKFDNNGILLLEPTKKAINSMVSDNGLYVMGGFYGANADGGRMTFGRGGSDITGAIVASAIGADIYENWTDVCGLCHVDPSRLCNVGSVRCLSYDNMQLLADYGVKVLNNYSIYPVLDSNIAINIRSIYNMWDSGTMVCNDTYSQQLLSMWAEYSQEQYITTIVSTYDTAWLCDNITRWATSNNIAIVVLTSRDNITVISTTCDVLGALYRHLVD